MSHADSSIMHTEGKGIQNFGEETFWEVFTWKTEGCGIYPSKVDVRMFS